MTRKQIYQTEAVQSFAASMSALSRSELAQGVRATQAQIDEAMRDPEFRKECSELDARYAAMELLESLLSSKSGLRKLNSYRDNYHRDFDITVSFGADDEECVRRSSRELAFA